MYFPIKTQNVRENKHLEAIETVLASHGITTRLQYDHKQNNWDEIRGGGPAGDIPDAVADEIRALPIPEGAKIRNTTSSW